MAKPRISIIAAVGKNRELGTENDLIWRIPEDLKRFKALTMGHPIIMGRKTYLSIGKPLSGRTNIVITRGDFEAEGCTVVHSIEEALQVGQNLDTEEIFVIGGGQIYTEFLPYTDRLYLTVIDRTHESADAYFPDYSAFTKEITREEHFDAEIPFTWVTLEM